MNHWPFIIAAYALTFGGTIALILWTYSAMRTAEKKVESLRKGNEE